MILLKRIVIYKFHGVIKVYGLRSLYIFKGDNILRITAVWLTESKYVIPRS